MRNFYWLWLTGVSLKVILVRSGNWLLVTSELYDGDRTQKITLGPEMMRSKAGHDRTTMEAKTFFHSKYFT